MGRPPRRRWRPSPEFAILDSVLRPHNNQGRSASIKLLSVSETMPFKTSCPKTLQVPDAAVGKRAKCPACQHVLLISGPPLAERRAVAAPACANSRRGSQFECLVR